MCEYVMEEVVVYFDYKGFMFFYYVVCYRYLSEEQFEMIEILFCKGQVICENFLSFVKDVLDYYVSVKVDNQFVCMFVFEYYMFIRKIYDQEMLLVIIVRGKCFGKDGDVGKVGKYNDRKCDVE